MLGEEVDFEGRIIQSEFVMKIIQQNEEHFSSPRSHSSQMFMLQCLHNQIDIMKTLIQMKGPK